MEKNGHIQWYKIRWLEQVNPCRYKTDRLWRSSGDQSCWFGPLFMFSLPATWTETNGAAKWPLCWLELDGQIKWPAESTHIGLSHLLLWLTTSSSRFWFKIQSVTSCHNMWVRSTVSCKFAQFWGAWMQSLWYTGRRDLSDVSVYLHVHQMWSLTSAS